MLFLVKEVENEDSAYIEPETASSGSTHEAFIGNILHCICYHLLMLLFSAYLKLLGTYS